MTAVASNGIVLGRAAHLVAVHGLRAYDGIQLASAVAARDADGSVVTFLCADTELVAAARLEGFDVPDLG